MKDSIQNKINKIQEIALASASEKNIADDRDVTESNYSDNLTKSIRNKKEAELFFSELKSAIDLAKRNSIRNILE
ncbi:hypothetical protein SAMN05444671_2057 [Flavobacterium sp. CF108]|jgi:hypothetical protein|uniref:hypothetical protein n=1 Tax=unclassified Flavobacterium TaxID=196869 RepID=UPI0008C9979D|nr:MULTISPECIES: hypothetical protein [unclassified Flavobacterium]SEN66740.1 hypothetical protein SAMN04487978_1373 [Flavobacterium sp. fv08]SHH07017.1 hypothetical protein SAMN05444671_2057 [Flavobacterium sp. CF108]